MSLKDDIGVVNNYIAAHCCDETIFESWDNIVKATNKLSIVPGTNAYTHINEPDIVDSTPVYRCVCGFEWHTHSERDQYCPKCNEKMELVK